MASAKAVPNAKVGLVDAAAETAFIAARTGAHAVTQGQLALAIGALREAARGVGVAVRQYIPLEELVQLFSSIEDDEGHAGYVCVTISNMAWFREVALVAAKGVGVELGLFFGDSSVATDAIKAAVNERTVEAAKMMLCAMQGADIDGNAEVAAAISEQLEEARALGREMAVASRGGGGGVGGGGGGGAALPTAAASAAAAPAAAATAAAASAAAASAATAAAAGAAEATAAAAAAAAAQGADTQPVGEAEDVATRVAAQALASLQLFSDQLAGL